MARAQVQSADLDKPQPTRLEVPGLPGGRAADSVRRDGNSPCSAASKPIRDLLNAAGYHAVIVMDEPSLRGDFGPEDKVDGYLEAADAFVALATHDKRMGPSATAGNILDEIARARRLPGLRDVVLVMKEDGVKLPSNINPVYELLDGSGEAGGFGTKGETTPDADKSASEKKGDDGVGPAHTPGTGRAEDKR